MASLIFTVASLTLLCAVSVKIYACLFWGLSNGFLDQKICRYVNKGGLNEAIHVCLKSMTSV